MPAPPDFTAGQPEAAVAARLASLLMPQRYGRVLCLGEDTGPFIQQATGHVDHISAAQFSFSLPYADGSFELVVGLYPPAGLDAAHLLGEAARVGVPGGVIAIADQIVPNHKRAGHYVAAFERLRGAAGSLYPMWLWTKALEQAELWLTHAEVVKLRHSLLETTGAAQWPGEKVTRLQAMLLQAPKRAAAWLEPAGTAYYLRFLTHHAVLLGQKPSG